jgi:iron(III)-enterobactin esterase
MQTKHIGLMLCLSAATAAVTIAAAPTPPATTPATTPAASAPAPGGRGARGGGRGAPVPTRDPNTEGYVKKTELEDGKLPPLDNGNFTMGPTHTRHPLMTQLEGVPRGRRETFQITSAESKIYPGIAREGANTNDPTNPNKLIVTTRPQPWNRTITVYIPAQYVPGTEVCLLVTADNGTQPMAVLDNLIHQKKVPIQICVAIPNGGGDAQGSQRGLEYDEMSPRYANFVETEILPKVEANYNIKITKDPNGRATMGNSSGGSAAFAMAWYRNDLYNRVLTYSGTYVNQQWPHVDSMPGGAWELHKSIIPNSPKKNLRIWMQVGDRDLLNPNTMRDEMHDWVVANERMAKVLADKGYEYQYVFMKNAGHTDGAAIGQTLPHALEYIWKGYPIK